MNIELCSMTREVASFDRLFKMYHAKESVGENKHFCPFLDFKPIDSTCEEFSECGCKEFDETCCWGGL